MYMINIKKILKQIFKYMAQEMLLSSRRLAGCKLKIAILFGRKIID